MPARPSDGKNGDKGVMEKLRVRRPRINTPNKRTRNVRASQLQRHNGVIVTMSVEQNSGIALKTTECVTASHTRHVSTTSTMFGPLGVSIGVMCESTTQNKEVVMDCLNNDAMAALDWHEENATNPFTFDFRENLNFLEDQQFQMLREIKIKNLQQLLNTSIRKLIEINLRSDQWQSLVTLLQSEMRNGSKPIDLSTENIQSLQKIQEELSQLDANDDDDEQPLVIDESISVIEENKVINERSLDNIEDSISNIKNVKIPKTRASLKGVKTELTEIITELNGKERRLMRQLHQSKQSNDTTLKSEMSTRNGTEEIVTTTNVTRKTAKATKRAKGQRTVKRRRNVKTTNNYNSKTDNTVTNTNIHENMTSNTTSSLKGAPCIESLAPITTANPILEISALNVISQSPQSFDVETSSTDGNQLSHIDATTSKTASPLTRGVFFINPQSVVVVHEDVVKSSGLLDSTIIKKRPQRRPTNNALLLDVSDSNMIASSSEQFFGTSNLSTIDALPLSDIDKTETLPKGYMDCKVVEQTIRKQLKPISATPTQTKIQPTVKLKKLPTAIRANEHNVDADSTTASFDQIGVRKANTVNTVAEEKSSYSELSSTPQAIKTKLVKPQKDDKKHISDDVDEQLEICASNDTESVEKIEILDTGNPKSEVLEKTSANETKTHESTKTVSPESPLFESIKTDSDELEESGIIPDNHNSSKEQKDIGQDSPSTSQKLIEDVSIEKSEKPLPSYLNSTPIENCKNSKPTQRCIDFDTQSQETSKSAYVSYNADSIVTIANTPLSPISSGIASPINSKIVLSDFRNSMEIDAYYAGIIYLLKEIDMPKFSINKPDDVDLLIRKNPSDPRLFKYLKKNANVIQMPSSLSVYNKVPSQIDPRRPSSIYNNTEAFVNPRPQPETVHTTPNMLLYGCLQRSPWYQSLMSTMKIQINQTISVLVRAINNFQQIRLEDPYAVFDIFKLYCAGELLEIMENLGLFVDVNGVISEKKSISSFAGRSYGCSSVVNATYSFIQPVEPSTVTVQHQQMRSFTAPQQHFTSAAQTTFPASQAPFISCYIDSPQLAIEKPVQFQQLQQPQEPQYNQKQYNHRPQQYNQKQYNPRPGKPSRGQFSSSGPRRHCGLKVPYSYGGPRNRSSDSPPKEESYTYGAHRAHSSASPAKENSYSYSVPRGRSSISPVTEAPNSYCAPPARPSYTAPLGRSSVSPSKETPSARSSVSPVKDEPDSESALPARSSVSPVRQQPRCSDSEGESWD
ncbi:serine-rich adhesin for platelets-like isoform X2 [Eurosta solidaginis]|uniref:serine-rich adhesin for platelets-like isoform X2 n=1 Tax=Eurosta solidaginis TaxID=178769 RepID=UPI003530AE21